LARPLFRLRARAEQLQPQVAIAEAVDQVFTVCQGAQQFTIGPGQRIERTRAATASRSPR
jgi:hypothetical protein